MSSTALSFAEIPIPKEIINSGNYNSAANFLAKGRVPERMLAESFYRLGNSFYSAEQNQAAEMAWQKSAVLAAGGPKNMTGVDDYYLWIRMITNGSKCANIPDMLIKSRTGNELMSRRGGISYIIIESKFQKILLDIKYMNS
jgi:hypothetical protein